MHCHYQTLSSNSISITFFLCIHCKPKPCKAHREFPVSQFPQGETCFHYREPLISLQGPCFHYRDFPVNPCTSLLGIAVYYQHIQSPYKKVLRCGLLWNKQYRIWIGLAQRDSLKFMNWGITPTRPHSISGLSLKIIFFGLKMMKSGLEKIFWNSTCAFKDTC